MAESISDQLRGWIATKSLRKVRFEEFHSPANDPMEDYTVKYEAQFTSADNEQAEVKITLTLNDFIGIGFETRTNVAHRLGVRNSRQGHAAGFEPCEKSKEQLLLFLNLVSDGKIGVRAHCLPLIGLTRTWAFALAQNVPTPFSFGPRNWLEIVAEPSSSRSFRTVRYKPWS